MSRDQSRVTVERSEALLIDTHKVTESRGPAVLAQPWGREELQQEQPKSRRELLAGTAAAMLLFLLVSAAMAWRCHRARRLAANKSRLLLADVSAGEN